MKKSNSSWLALLFCFIFIQNCATNKLFLVQDLASISNLEAVRLETPNIEVQGLGRMLTSAVGGFVLMGGLGSAIMVDANTNKMKVEEMDFGELVMKQFINKVNIEFPNWPSTTIKEQPVPENYIGTSTLLEFKVDRLFLGWLGTVNGGNGFLSTTIVTMKDINGKVLWKKTCKYNSGMFKRNKKIDEFLAKNGELLKEEITFAVKVTVSDLIENLKGGKEN